MIELGRVEFDVGNVLVCNLIKDYKHNSSNKLDNARSYKILFTLEHKYPQSYDPPVITVDPAEYYISWVWVRDQYQYQHSEDYYLQRNNILLKSSYNTTWMDDQPGPSYTTDEFEINHDNARPIVTINIIRRETPGDSSNDDIRVIETTFSQLPPCPVMVNASNVPYENLNGESYTQYNIYTLPLISDFTHGYPKYELVFRYPNGTVIETGLGESYPISVEIMSKPIGDYFEQAYWLVMYTPKLFEPYPNQNELNITSEIKITLSDGSVLYSQSVPARVKLKDFDPSIDSFVVNIDNTDPIIRDSWNNVAVEGYSKLSWEIVATPKYGATITMYEIHKKFIPVSGDSSEEVFTSTTPSGIVYDLYGGEYQFWVKVTDSRGTEADTSSNPVKIYVNQYINPRLVNPSVKRTTSSMTPADDGTYFTVLSDCSYSAVDYGGTIRNQITLAYAYYQTGNAPSSLSWTVFEKNVSTLSIDSIEDSAAYSVILRVTDTLGNYDEISFNLPTGIVTMHLRQGGKGIAFGQYSDTNGEKKVQSAWPFSSIGYEMQNLSGVKFPGQHIFPNAFNFDYKEENAIISKRVYIHCVTSPANYVILCSVQRKTGDENDLFLDYTPDGGGSVETYRHVYTPGSTCLFAMLKLISGSGTVELKQKDGSGTISTYKGNGAAFMIAFAIDDHVNTASHDI